MEIIIFIIGLIVTVILFKSFNQPEQKIPPTVETTKECNQFPDPLRESNKKLSKMLEDVSSDNRVLHDTINRLNLHIIELDNKNKTLFGKQKSEQVRLGSIAENLAPFLKDFKYNPKNLAACFNPIDYVAFEEDEIVFVEIKSGDADLSPKQKKIKKLIEEKKVRFEVYRIR